MITYKTLRCSVVINRRASNHVSYNITDGGVGHRPQCSYATGLEVDRSSWEKLLRICLTLFPSVHQYNVRNINPEYQTIIYIN